MLPLEGDDEVIGDEASAPSGRSRWWALGVGVVVITALGMYVVLSEPGGTSRSTPPTIPASGLPRTEVPPPDESETTTEPSATGLATSQPATVPRDPAFEGLAGHEWVQAPVDRLYPLVAAPSLRFGPDGTVDGFDGCSTWSDRMEIEDGHLRYRIGRTPPSSCAERQRELLDGSRFSIDDDGLVPTLRLDDEQGGSTAYLAADLLPDATTATAPGTWVTPTGEQLTLFPDGSAELGPCLPVARWNVDADGTLQITGFDDRPDQTVACGGGVQYGIAKPVVGWLVNATPMWARVGLGALLVTHLSGVSEWLAAGDNAEPALDLHRGTVGGFAPLTDIDPEFVVTTMDRSYGTATFDSGWSTIPPSGDDGDCMGGLDERVVVWDDIAFAFVRLDQVERLWQVQVGDVQALVVAELPAPTGVPTTHEGVGVGSTVEEFETAGFTVDNLRDATGAPVTDPLDARSAVVQSRNPVLLTLDHGTVTSIVISNPGFC